MHVKPTIGHKITRPNEKCYVLTLFGIQLQVFHEQVSMFRQKIALGVFFWALQSKKHVLKRFGAK